MPCFRPLAGYYSSVVNPSGKRSIVFSIREAYSDLQLVIPCGRCRYCRLEHSRQWAIRAMHEASLYTSNCFLTLTYSDEFLPPGGSLDYDAPVLFMKRLRKQFGEGIRSYGCAEYGTLLSRPHYHLCIFNFDFPDRVLFSRNRGFPLSTSATLSSLWPFGHSTVGDLSFESAAYTARYVTKKISGPPAQAHYEVVDPSSGECFTRLPERAICVSRRPGLGRAWIDKFSSHTREHDFVVLRGKQMRPPKYYDRLFDLADPSLFAKVKASRKRSGKEASQRMLDEDAHNRACFEAKRNPFAARPLDRLSVLEIVQESKFNLLPRGFEDA